MKTEPSSLPAVHLASIGIEMAPEVITSATLEDQLAAAWSTMGIAPGQLEQLTGVRERRWWPEGTSISEMAASACQKALESSHLPASIIGQLAYTGVCREAFEPATACSVAARLDLSRETELFDISNACLGAIDGVVLAADAIRLGRVDAALVVCCESARTIVDIACQRLLSDPCMDRFIPTLATLTGGSGAAAMLLVSSRVSTEGPVLLGSSVGTDARWHELCRWGVEPDQERSDPAARIEYMETDSIGVLRHGVELGVETWGRFLKKMDWAPEDIDRTICHQVGSAHREEILAALELSAENDFITYPFLGNMGTVSIPMTAALATERSFLSPGQKVAFLGIGSGLVCRMIGWEWPMNRLFVDEEYPYRSHRWDRGSGIHMHYVDEGRGDPIICVHGNPTWSFYFRKLVQELSRSHRVIAVDHVGCGFSDFPDEDQYGYRLADRIDDLERLLDHLEITSDAMLVAHDWGGAIGFGVAGRNPGRFSSLVAMNTAAFRLPDGKEFPKILRPVRGPLGEFLIRGLNAFVNGTLMIGTRLRKLSRTERADYRSPYHDWRSRLAIHRFVQDIPLQPSDPSWETLVEVETGLSALADHPLLLLWGVKDPVFDESFLDEWRSRFPDARHRKWQGCGHLLLDDAAGPVILEIRSFRESIARERSYQ